jgi:hypothetical protein
MCCDILEAAIIENQKRKIILCLAPLEKVQIFFQVEKCKTFVQNFYVSINAFFSLAFSPSATCTTHDHNTIKGIKAKFH